MQNIVLNCLALVQVAGLCAMLAALKKAVDGLEDSRGFHRVVECRRDDDREFVSERTYSGRN